MQALNGFAYKTLAQLHVHSHLQASPEAVNVTWEMQKMSPLQRTVLMVNKGKMQSTLYEGERRNKDELNSFRDREAITTSPLSI